MLGMSDQAGGSRGPPAPLGAPGGAPLTSAEEGELGWPGDPSPGEGLGWPGDMTAARTSAA